MTTHALDYMQNRAHSIGLCIDTWSPGDGMTRYRFFRWPCKPLEADYFGGRGLVTVKGRREAELVLRGAELGAAQYACRIGAPQ